MAGRPKGALNQKTKRRTKRTCLKCGRDFASLGPENRICWKCNHENEQIYVPPSGRVNLPVD